MGFTIIHWRIIKVAREYLRHPYERRYDGTIPRALPKGRDGAIDMAQTPSVR